MIKLWVSPKSGKANQESLAAFPGGCFSLDLLELLASKTNREILTLLKNEPTYPRRLSILVGVKEQKIVPRLRAMEEAGLLKSSWSRVKGRNVKLYEVQTEKMELVLSRTGLKLDLLSKADQRPPLPPPYLSPKIEVDPNFVGREGELKLMSEEDSSLIVLEGISGMGKSSLLQAFASSRMAKDLQVFWYSFKETDSFDYLVSKLATFLSEQGSLNLVEYLEKGGKDDSVKLDLLTRAIDRSKYLLILDDYQRHHDEKIDSLLRSLQDGTSQCKMIIASRIRPRFLTITARLTEIQLEGLGSEDCTRLLSLRGVDLSREEGELIYSRTSGHPLAVTLLAGILKKDRTALKDLTSAGKALDKVKDDLLESLNENERDLLISISAFRDPIPANGILDVIKRPRIQNSLHSLEKRMVLKRLGDYYQLNEIVRDGCYKLLDDPTPLHKKIGDWYLSRSTPQDVLEGLYHQVGAENLDLVKEILLKEGVGEGSGIIEDGFSSALIDILRNIPGALTRPEDVWWISCIQLIAYSNLLKWSKAKELVTKLEQALKSEKNTSTLARIHETLGQYYIYKDELQTAEENFLKSSELFRISDDRNSLQRVYLRLARLSFVEGEPTRSMKYIDPELT